VRRRLWLLALTAAIPIVVGPSALAQAPKKLAKEQVSFGTLRALSPDEARSQALAWLKGVGPADATKQKAFEAIWKQTDRTVVDRVGDTLALGDPEAAKLLAEVRDLARPAPLTVPAILKDAKKPLFYRANLALAYAKTLSVRRVYEESLQALKTANAEQVVDPSAYLFYRAVAEHSLLLKDDATRSIVRLLDDTLDVPDRYKMVSVLMAFDMQSWKAKDLGEIARKMDNIERRLELARGGPHTQKIQKEVVARLDEIIKKLENECNGNCQGNGGACPNGGKPGAGAPNSPQRDSYGGKNSGPGNVDQKKLEALAQKWGQLPEKDRADAMQQLTRDMGSKYREVIENYFKKLAASESNNSRP
jgi:hypothetical protein